MPSSRCSVAQQVEDLRLDGDVERGGRLVGDQQRRLRRRAPWRSSPAGACRPTAGADSRRRRWAADGMPTRSSRAIARLRAARLGRGRDAERKRLGATWPPIDSIGVQRRHRLPEDHGEAVAAERRLSRASASRWARDRGRRSGWRRVSPGPDPAGSSTDGAGAVTLLPPALLSPTSATVSRGRRRRSPRPRPPSRRGCRGRPGRRRRRGLLNFQQAA